MRFEEDAVTRPSDVAIHRYENFLVYCNGDIIQQVVLACCGMMYDIQLLRGIRFKDMMAANTEVFFIVCPKCCKKWDTLDLQKEFFLAEMVV